MPRIPIAKSYICRYDSKAHGSWSVIEVPRRGREAGNAMSIEIDVLKRRRTPGLLAEPLFMAVWPPDVRREAAVGRLLLAYPEWRVLVRTDRKSVVSHVGIQRPRDHMDMGARCGPAGIGGRLDPPRTAGAAATPVLRSMPPSKP